MISSVLCYISSCICYTAVLWLHIFQWVLIFHFYLLIGWEYVCGIGARPVMGPLYNLPTVHPSDDRWKLWRICSAITEKGNQSTRDKKNCPWATLSTTHPTWTDLELNPVLYCQMSNELSHSMEIRFLTLTEHVVRLNSSWKTFNSWLHEIGHFFSYNKRFHIQQKEEYFTLASLIILMTLFLFVFIWLT